MSVVKLKYVNSYKDRHGSLRHYFRKGAVKEPLLGMPGSAVFMDEYKRLLALHAPAKPSKHGKPEVGTLSWVIQQYKTTSARWKKLKPRTRAIYERRFLYLNQNYGVAEFASFTESGVRTIRNKLADTPSVADATVDIIGMLWRFAKEHIDGMDKLGRNPTTEVAAIHTEHKAHPAWPPDLCALVEKHCNPKVVRAYFLLRYTGQRRSDVAQMKASQFDGTAVELVQEKTGAYVWLPAHKALRDHLTTRTDSNEYLLISNRKTRYTDESLTRLICDACDQAGFPGYSPHGLRHLAGAALAEAGCSVHEIMSVLGHVTEREAMEYVRQANRKKMAATAVAKWNANSE
jgi:integrase